MNLRVGSICSGIGGDAVAWHPLGWTSVFFSEIEKFPSAVLAHRCPGAPNLGDFTAPDFCDRARAAGPIDVLAGGTPCQAFSVAGKRGSCDDSRGNLTLRFVEVVHELDPTVVVWENVPGVLSTEDNAFGCFLGGMVGADAALIPCDDCGSHYAKRYWRTRVVQDDEGKPSECWRYPVWPDYGMVAGPVRTLAWRILDAQHFGLAQRRRRVIVVSVRTRDGINPGAVLFEPESVRRDSAPGREAGAGVAPTIAARTKGGGGLGTDFECDGGLIPEISPALKAQDYKGPSSDGAGDGAPLIPVTTHSLRAEGFDASEDGTGRGTPIVPFSNRGAAGNVPKTLRAGSHGALPMVAFQCHGSNVGPMGALRKGNGNEAGGVSFVAFDTTQITSRENRSSPKPGDPCHPLASGAHAPALAQAISVGANQTTGFVGKAVAAPDLRVRRLTPREAERLQGFPDDFSLIPWRGKPAEACPDGPRYKGLGNAWATHVFRWIGQRIESVLTARKNARGGLARQKTPMSRA